MSGCAGSLDFDKRIAALEIHQVRAEEKEVYFRLPHQTESFSLRIGHSRVVAGTVHQLGMSGPAAYIRFNNDNDFTLLSQWGIPSRDVGQQDNIAAQTDAGTLSYWIIDVPNERGVSKNRKNDKNSVFPENSDDAALDFYVRGVHQIGRAHV